MYEAALGVMHGSTLPPMNMETPKGLDIKDGN